MLLLLCTEGEKLGPGEIDGFIQDVVASRVLLEFTSEISSLSEPKEMFGKGLNITLSGLDNFLSALSEGKYDVLDTKIKVSMAKVGGAMVSIALAKTDSLLSAACSGF